jgi:hypothetical protein
MHGTHHIELFHRYLLGLHSTQSALSNTYKLMGQHKDRKIADTHLMPGLGFEIAITVSERQKIAQTLYRVSPVFGSQDAVKIKINTTKTFRFLTAYQTTVITKIRRLNTPGLRLA